MADAKISALDAKTTVHDTDVFPIVDIEADPDETKKITGANMKTQMTSAHAALTTGVHGAGTFYLLHSEGVLPIAGEILRQLDITAPTPFSGAINGNPTTTSVVYDGDTNEGSMLVSSGAGYWGRQVLHNTTRSNSRKIVSVNVSTNTITTEASTDNWANNDVITTQSQTNTEAGYVDIDLSAEISANTYCIWISAQVQDKAGLDAAAHGLFIHPYKTYNAGLRAYTVAALANEVSVVVFPVEVISQKITLYARGVTQSYNILTCKGVLQ